MQVLQIVATDRETGCHLGTCVAVRLSEAVPLVNSQIAQHHDDPADTVTSATKFTIKQLDFALRCSGVGKRSKQRFLNTACKDFYIKKSRQGTGGNTLPYSCVIVQQSAATIESLRKGTFEIPLLGSLYKLSWTN